MERILLKIDEKVYVLMIMFTITFLAFGIAFGLETEHIRNSQDKVIEQNQQIIELLQQDKGE